MRANATQSSPTANPDIRITIGADVYTSQDSGRLIRATLDEQVWGGQYVVELDNSDEALNAKNYKGSAATIYLGFIGETGSNLSPLWVHNQQFISREGRLLLQLNCIDAWGLLAQVNADLAGAAYNQEWQQTANLDKLRLPSGELLPAALKTAIAANYNKTIKSILDDLIGTIGKTVSLDNDDGIVNTYKPPINVTNPISGVRRLLDMTKSYLLWKSGGTFGIIQPDITPDPTDYSYSVANLFFSNLEDAAVVIPNRITFYSLNEAGDDWINGTPAVDSASYTALGVYIDRRYLLAHLDVDVRASAATLTALATGALAKIQGERSQGTLVAPMHCSQELFDKISVVDSRYTTPKTTTGYIHRIVREYDRGIYRITIQLGGVTSGYTPPGGSIAIPLAEAAPPARTPDWLPTFMPAYLPAVIDIVFTAVDSDDISWAAGTIKTADGSVWTVNAGSLNLANVNVYYLYYDVVADTHVLANTQTFGDTVSTERILVGFAKKASTPSEKALIVIGSQGKDLYIDVLSAITANLGLINAGEIRLGTGTLGSNYSGWRLWLESSIGRMAGYSSDIIQWYSATDGKLYAGAGAVRLDEYGLTIVGQDIRFTDVNETYNSYIYTGLNGDIVILPPMDKRVYIYQKGLICPNRLRIPVGANMYG